MATPRIFAAPDTHLAWLKNYCNAANPKSVVGIDMTYKIGPYYVTTLVMQMPIFVWKDRPNHHPGIVAALSISVCKQEDDYLYLSQQLKAHGKLETLVYGTDGEVAMENAFEQTFPVTSECTAMIFHPFFSGMRVSTCLLSCCRKIKQNWLNSLPCATYVSLLPCAI